MRSIKSVKQAACHWVNSLTHWGRVTHICVGKLIIIGSDNGLSPGRRQAIIWTNAGIWLMRPLGTKFSEILIAIHTFSFKKMHLKMSSAKWRLFCLGLNVLKPNGAYRKITSLLIQFVAWCLISAKSLPKPVLTYCQMYPLEQASVKFKSKYYTFLIENIFGIVSEKC